MALDNASRQYADKLFHQHMEEILKEQTSDLVKVRQDHAARNMTMSGQSSMSDGTASETIQPTSQGMNPLDRPKPQ